MQVTSSPSPERCATWSVIPLVVICAGIAVALAAGCGSRDSAGPPSPGSAVSATTTPPPVPAPTAPGHNDRADTTPPPAPAGTPRAAAGSGAPPSAGPQRPAQCDDLNADDAMAQAQNQYSAGFAKAALLLATRALECRQDDRMYRLAASYACAAHDAAAAKLYYSKVPSQFQAAILQRCQQENIRLR
jgi:hypothetical protein